MAQRVIVVGGGISGLAAAHRLRELAPDMEVVVLEGSEHPGGKIRTVPFAGRAVETGAETFLVRDPAALGLAQRLGLAGDLVHPADVPAALAIDGELRPIPPGTLMGISPEARTDRDTDGGRPLLDGGADVTVGALVRERFGDEAVDHLVDPLLGGVYAGRADDLSLQATIPGLHRAAQSEHTLRRAVRAAMQAAPRPAGSPVFATLHGGLSRLVAALAAGTNIECRQTVRGLRRAGRGWRIRAGIETGADAVVLAVPARPAGRLLSGLDIRLAELPYASMALVTLALPAGTELPELSGLLVPADQGYAVKAATFFTTKWPHLRGDSVLLRASLGRYGQTGVLRLTDEALVSLVCEELPRLIARPLPMPTAWRVSRWGGALPQYGVGHVARVARLREQLPPTLAVAGAAYDGVGIAACVRSGEAAAERVLAGLRG